MKCCSTKASPTKSVRASVFALTAVLCCSITGLNGGPTALTCSNLVYAATSITPTIGAGDLGTQVLLPIGPVYGITGGTPVDTNLYHSFAQFNVGTGDIAQFQTGPSSPPNTVMLNILGRITDANPSTIFGTIDSATYYPNANLFLMNPYGFLFGPNAMLNVGGMVAFTTADYLRLTDNIRFEAIPGAQDALLSTASVAAFGFLGSNSAAIAVQGSQLTVADGTGLSLIGGNQGFFYTNPDTGARASVPDGVTITGGGLLAPGGQINLASVASAGELLQGTLEPGPNINGNSFTAMGNISLSQGTLLDVSANAAITAAGTVRIRGGQFVIADATLSADTVSDGALTALDIKVTGDLLISDTRGVPAITARTLGSGDAGEIWITSGNLTATSSFVDPSFLPTTLIDSHTEGTGNAGNVHIATGNLSVSGLGGFFGFTFIDSGTAGPGNGASVTINVRDIQTNSTTFVSTGDFLANQVLLDISGVTGSAGNLTIEAGSLHLQSTLLDMSSTAAGSEIQQAGNLSITAHDINIVNGQINTIGNGRGGGITINTDRIVTENSFFETDTAFGPGGGITVIANVVELTNGSTLASNTFGDGNAGGIQVTAYDHVSLLGPTSSSPTGTFRPSGLFSNSFAFVGSHGGDAGHIVVTTPRLELTGGRINTSTETGGHGGNVTINANVISMSGEFANPDTAEPIYQITDIHPSGIFTKTVGNEFCGDLCGDAGTISITTGSLVMGSGSQIDSGTSSTGHGGDIVIHATNQISMSGTLSNGDPVGIFSRTVGTVPESREGGNIALTAGQSVTISNGASVSASSTGPGNAGNISINAGQQFDMRNSSVKTEAVQASGGNIDIQAVNQIRLVDSTISTSVLGGAGSGGNITIDPNIVVLQNSNVIAQAVQGAGGNITITTPLFLADQTSLVSASSQFGLNGPVTIQGPTSNLSGSVGTLPSDPSQAQSLLTQRCAALANGQASSFVVAGREQLPADPGGWLTSPLALAGIDAEDASHLAPRTSALLATDRISLRRLTPARFLIANFADSEATGCHS